MGSLLTARVPTSGLAALRPSGGEESTEQRCSGKQGRCFCPFFFFFFLKCSGVPDEVSCVVWWRWLHGGRRRRRRGERERQDLGNGVSDGANDGANDGGAEHQGRGLYHEGLHFLQVLVMSLESVSRCFCLFKSLKNLPEGNSVPPATPNLPTELRAGSGSNHGEL